MLNILRKVNDEGEKRLVNRYACKQICLVVKTDMFSSKNRYV